MHNVNLFVREVTCPRISPNVCVRQGDEISMKPPVALDLDHEMQRVIGAVPIIHQHDEVGQTIACPGAVAIRHFQTEVVVLCVGDHLGMRFSDAAELRLPIAVEHDPIDVVLRRRAARFPTLGTRRIEPDMPGGASRIVGIEQRLDRPLAEKLPGDRRGDAVAGHVGQFLIHEERGIGATFAHEAGIEPLLGDALELTEEVEFWLRAGVAPFRVEQALGDLEDERGVPDVAQVREAHVHAFADNARVARDGGADDVRAEQQDGVVVEIGGQPFLGNSTR